jgi:hypothetical protein
VLRRREEATVPVPAGQEALEWRDRALAALDGADPRKALELARRGLAVLGETGPGDGLDEAALLIAVAEIEERLDQFEAAGESVDAAIGLLRSLVTSAAAGRRWPGSSWRPWSSQWASA